MKVAIFVSEQGIFLKLNSFFFLYFLLKAPWLLNSLWLFNIHTNNLSRIDISCVCIDAYVDSFIENPFTSENSMSTNAVTI